MQRAGYLTAEQVVTALGLLARAPVARHLLTPLLAGAWERRTKLRPVDALDAELAEQTRYPLLTTDQRLVRGWPHAVAITPCRVTIDG